MLIYLVMKLNEYLSLLLYYKALITCHIYFLLLLFVRFVWFSPALIKEDCVVRLRGLPFQVCLKDVAGFLSGLNFIP